MSKIGVHSILGPRKGFGDFLKKIASAGQTLAVVKCVDDFGPAKEAKELISNTLTVGRLNVVRDAEGQNVDTQGFEPLLPGGSYRSAREVAEWFYELVKPKWQANPFIDVWETFNEFSAHWGWQSDFYLAMMDLAEPDGFKLAHYACSTGNPPNAAVVQEMLPCLRAAKQRGHYLSLHEYGGVGTDIPTLKGTQPFHALRYRELYETILIPSQADARLIISECGQESGARFVGTQMFVEDFTWYDAELMKDEYMVGACAWTLGNWADANFQEALPALADYIAATPNRPAQPSQAGRSSPVFGEPAAAGAKPPATPKQPTKPAPMATPAGQSRPRGAPRAEFVERIYLLLPNEPPTPEGNARLDRWIQAVAASGILSRHRWTLGTSADDAAVGDLDKRAVVAINPETWPTPLADFYASEYPGVQYSSVQAATPDELRKLLANM